MSSPQGMCANLVDKGKLTSPLIIYNRTAQRAQELAAKIGGDRTTVAASVAEAVAAADIVFTCLGEDHSVSDTIDTALQGDVTGKLFVDCSTIHPTTTNALAKAVTAKGAEFVAMPGRNRGRSGVGFEGAQRLTSSSFRSPCDGGFWAVGMRALRPKGGR